MIHVTNTPLQSLAELACDLEINRLGKPIGKQDQYMAAFAGCVNNMGYNACDEITKLREVLDQFDLKSEIIIGSTREVLNTDFHRVFKRHFYYGVQIILRGL